MKTLKYICLGVAFALLIVFAVTGSLGDDSADRTYLNIVQSEFERVSGGLQIIRDGRELIPVSEDNLTKARVQLTDSFLLTDKSQNEIPIDVSLSSNMYTAENALDHIVVVTNVGNTDGYVRTWFAFEMGELSKEEFQEYLILNKNLTEWSWTEFEYGVSIENKKYAVVCAEYNDTLKAKQTTAPNLLQILLCNGVSNDVVFRLDGDHDGKYEVIAYSQAVSDKNAWGAIESPWR